MCSGAVLAASLSEPPSATCPEDDERAREGEQGHQPHHELFRASPRPPRVVHDHGEHHQGQEYASARPRDDRESAHGATASPKPTHSTRVRGHRYAAQMKTPAKAKPDSANSAKLSDSAAWSEAAPATPSDRPRARSPPSGRQGRSSARPRSPGSGGSSGPSSAPVREPRRSGPRSQPVAHQQQHDEQRARTDTPRKRRLQRLVEPLVDVPRNLLPFEQGQALHRIFGEEVAVQIPPLDEQL